MYICMYVCMCVCLCECNTTSQVQVEYGTSICAGVWESHENETKRALLFEADDGWQFYVVLFKVNREPEDIATTHKEKLQLALSWIFSDVPPNIRATVWTF